MSKSLSSSFNLTGKFWAMALIVCCLGALSAGTPISSAQQTEPSTPAERDTSFNTRQQMHENGLFKDMAFRCVGPVVMSGRVVDIEPIPGQPYSFYVAYATGGL